MTEQRRAIRAIVSRMLDLMFSFQIKYLDDQRLLDDFDYSGYVKAILGYQDEVHAEFPTIDEFDDNVHNQGPVYDMYMDTNTHITTYTPLICEMDELFSERWCDCEKIDDDAEISKLIKQGLIDSIRVIIYKKE